MGYPVFVRRLPWRQSRLGDDPGRQPYAFVAIAENGRGDKVQDGGTAFGDRVGHRRFGLAHGLSDRGAEHVKNIDADNRKHQVSGINRPELPRGNAVADDRCHFPHHRSEERLDQARQVLGGAAARPHHLVLHQTRITILAANVIKVLAGKAQYLFARSQVAVQNPLQPLKTHAEDIVEHRAVKRLFAAENSSKEALCSRRRPVRWSRFGHRPTPSSANCSLAASRIKRRLCSAFLCARPGTGSASVI